MAYRDPKKATEMQRDILNDLQERGCTDIQLHSSGETIHMTAFDPKKKKCVQVFGKPYVNGN
ncbi:hypothetical protein BIZ78_gp250 [Erwinia phage vB_EamM_Caitlin]|uniref:hypothetical protein n=1 Tax=Erwinia phage vB_EamM_Caitlin TaxID=1883379 RepID=UPI00081CDCA1|nr:hypothetical protein BIZ78_gp250 [Erwinia phage vB_EamM_Caitlin]ANZ48325.1 hypothetical protein CAITLIN_30 [Erwinia phage vB_EamM_Caitlin]